MRLCEEGNLFDMAGNLIEGNIALNNTSTNISTNGFSAGMYFYSISDSDGKMLDRGKLVVN